MWMCSLLVLAICVVVALSLPVEEISKGLLMKRDDLEVLLKRSLALGRSRFRPGKRSAEVNEGLVPEDLIVDTDFGDEELVRLAEEDSMGKRSMVMGREGGRPSKRSLALGRSGFRPGKRSIALGRKDFRPGKRRAIVGQIPVLVYSLFSDDLI